MLAVVVLIIVLILVSDLLTPLFVLKRGLWGAVSSFC